MKKFPCNQLGQRGGVAPIAVVLGNLLEELIQGGGHVGYRRSILFGQVFLLEDEAGQGRT